MKTIFPSIEPLEARIAPATLNATGTILTYTDVDGDHVTVTFSKGGAVPGDFTFGSGSVNGNNTPLQQLERIDISNHPLMTGTNIAVTVVKGGSGDGLVAIGDINADTLNLGKVTIAGDLGAIDAGADTVGTPAIQSLSVRSMGRYTVATNGSLENLVSTLSGGIGSLNVTGDVQNVTISANSPTPTNDNIGSIVIGGSLLGGDAANSGEIYAQGNIGSVKIGHDIYGGKGTHSGFLFSQGTLGNVTVGGSIYGGGAFQSGLIYSTGNMGNVTIAHNVQGGPANSTGYIGGAANGGNITIGGALTGDAGSYSGAIDFIGNIKLVKIGHSVDGGSASFAGSISANATGGVTIGGSLVGGTATDTGALVVGGNAGIVKIGGDMQGSAQSTTGAISAGTISSITVGGSVIGGAGDSSGQIYTSAGDIGFLKIGHDLLGGGGQSSGSVFVHSTLTTALIGGSVIGGAGDNTGQINFNDAGSISLGGDLLGGSNATSTGLSGSGIITSNSFAQHGHIGSVTIGGSIIAGVSSGTGGISNGASIEANLDIGSVTVKGGIIGNYYSKVVISAAGQAFPTATMDSAIGKISIGHQVEYGLILGGFAPLLAEKNGNAQIGAVTVGGDWIDSSISAGITNTMLPNFADDNDVPMAGNTGLARIASIVIGGIVTGTPSSVISSDNFGFCSHTIGSLKIHGTAIALPVPGTGKNISPLTFDVDVRLD